jgi:hypothetical protein
MARHIILYRILTEIEVPSNVKGRWILTQHQFLLQSRDIFLRTQLKPSHKDRANKRLYSVCLLRETQTQPFFIQFVAILMSKIVPKGSANVRLWILQIQNGLEKWFVFIKQAVWLLFNVKTPRKSGCSKSDSLRKKEYGCHFTETSNSTCFPFLVSLCNTASPLGTPGSGNGPTLYVTAQARNRTLSWSWHFLLAQSTHFYTFYHLLLPSLPSPNFKPVLSPWEPPPLLLSKLGMLSLITNSFFKLQQKGPLKMKISLGHPSVSHGLTDANFS